LQWASDIAFTVPIFRESRISLCRRVVSPFLCTAASGIVIQDAVKPQIPRHGLISGMKSFDAMLSGMPETSSF
jgi:hypothetical protein